MTHVVDLRPTEYDGTSDLLLDGVMVGSLHYDASGKVLGAAETSGDTARGQRILIAWHDTEEDAMTWCLCVHTGEYFAPPEPTPLLAKLARLTKLKPQDDDAVL